MLILETFLMTLLLCTAGYATYTDFKTGLIPNRLLLISGAAALAADTMYYGIFASFCLECFLVNLAVTVLLSLLLYGYHFWGAGDSKLMMFIVLAMPARYYINSQIPLPALTVTVYTFAIAFVYLTFESVILGIKQKNLFSTGKKVTPAAVMKLVKSYFISYAYILLISFGEMLLPGDLLRNTYIAPLLNFFIIFTIFSFELLKKWYVVALVTAADIVLYFVFLGSAEGVMPSAFNIIVIAAVLVFRSLAEKYNYKTVKTSEITPGTVLAMSTVMLFQGSRVKGLPTIATEDLRSRISAEEAESIKRWENSKTGKHEILIVRKLPFAVFITVGTIAFLVLRRCGF